MPPFSHLSHLLKSEDNNKLLKVLEEGAARVHKDPSTDDQSRHRIITSHNSLIFQKSLILSILKINYKYELKQKMKYMKNLSAFFRLQLKSLYSS